MVEVENERVREFAVKRLTAAAAALLTLFSIAAAALAQSPDTAVSASEIKAAFLYNFAKFVDWPDTAFSGARAAFTICVAGDELSGILDRLVRGEMLDSRPLVARRIKAGDEVRGCQIVYVPDNKDARLGADIIRAAGEQPILTVGETASFVTSGGIMRFFDSGGKVRFEINPGAAARAHLKVSSRLLRLAEIAGTEHPQRRLSP